MRDAEEVANALGKLLLPHPADLPNATDSEIDRIIRRPLWQARQVQALSAQNWDFADEIEDREFAHKYSEWNTGLVADHAFIDARIATRWQRPWVVVAGRRLVRQSSTVEPGLLNLAVGALSVGVSAVGVRGERSNRIGVGFEDLSSPLSKNLGDTLREEFGRDVDLYQTGRITAQSAPNGSHDPVLPGCAVSARKSSFGTFGAVVEADHLGGYGLISNAHVLDQRDGGVVWQPRVNGRGSRRIGKSFQVVAPAKDQVNTCDAAVASLDSGVAYESRPLAAPQNFGAVLTDQISTGTSVVKSGASTGLTSGILDQVGTRVAVWYGRTLMVFERQYQIVSASDGGFSSPGDSGSVVATQEGWHPFGLLFAGNGQYSWASPFPPVLVLFGVSLV